MGQNRSTSAGASCTRTALDGAHVIAFENDAAPPMHAHKHKTSSRTALLLILGSSPMVEGNPAFLAAGKYGFPVLASPMLRVRVPAMSQI